MVGHQLDSLQMAKAGNELTAIIEKTALHKIVEEIFGKGQFANIVENVLDKAVDSQLDHSLTACQAVEEAGKDPVSAEKLMQSTLGASKITPDFYACKTPQERSCWMIDALSQNNVDLNGDEMKTLVDASKGPGGKTRVRQACAQMAIDHPVA